jgi:D-alanyl-D-alanine dipeptidase
MRIYLFFIAILFFQCTDQKKPEEVAKVEDTPPVEVEVIDTVEEAPPAEPVVVAPDYDTTEWAEIIRLDPTIKMDLRYATTNNFVDEKMYECGRCFLRPDVAAAVVKAHKELQTKGYGFKMFDCYRPRPIQWKLWNKVPDPRYVADPRKGSMHNRGMAVDLTIVDSLGNELPMGTDFDFFGEEAYHRYTGHSDEIAKNRALLLGTMKAHGFRPTSTEWWHYSYKPKKFKLDDWLWPCN